ncbi:MAG TPA: hypothetical protein VLA68_00235 [Nitrososphaera sp.]|nr:hypothetical protein [Nitrososphaera sp.]
MQPQRKKVVVMMAVSLGIIVFSFLLPIVIIPAYFNLSNASGCAGSTGCAQDTYSRCGAYQASGNSSSFIDSMERGAKGMLCMLGLDKSESKFVAPFAVKEAPITLNKVLLTIG